MTQVDLGHYEFWLWKCSLFFDWFSNEATDTNTSGNAV